MMPSLETETDVLAPERRHKKNSLEDDSASDMESVKILWRSLLKDDAGRNYAVSMLALACADLAHPYYEQPKTRYEKEANRDHAAAEKWVLGQYRAICSFEECCDVLGWDIAQVRSRILTDPIGIHDRFVKNQNMQTSFPTRADWNNAFGNGLQEVHLPKPYDELELRM